MSRRLIFLIGMPGVGKSHWARVWANEYYWASLDLDRKIEQRESRKIADIFQKNGEAYFRNAEREALRSVIGESTFKTIVATGGGTPAFEDNMKLMLDAGVVIHLSADIETLVRQIRLSPSKRPLLQTENTEERLQGLLSVREQYYRQAHYTIRAEEATKDSLTPIFAACTDLH